MRAGTPRSRALGPRAAVVLALAAVLLPGAVLTWLPYTPHAASAPAALTPRPAVVAPAVHPATPTTYNVRFTFQPSYVAASGGNLEVEMIVSGTYYYTYVSAGCYSGYCYVNPAYSYPSQPWSFAAGTHLTASYVNGVSYYNGTGKGNYTGLGWDFNITVNSDINETAWAGGFGVYNETFAASGLPSTSVYHYTFDGATYSAPATQISIAPHVVTGAYTLSNVWANGSTAGWEYFGYADTGSVIVVPAEPTVSLAFAYVDLAASVGTITFQATGLSPGTEWQLDFNGTVYASNGSDLNVTEHPGTFPVTAFAATGSGGGVGYTPIGLPKFVAVTPGSPVAVTYTNAYLVTSLASVGGSIGGAGKGAIWIGDGANATFHAVAATAYAFGGWTGTGPGAYSGNDSWANFTVSGTAIESASFYPLPAARFNLTFLAAGLSPGIWWTVYVGGIGHSADVPQIVVGGLLPCGPGGTYSLTVPYASGATANASGLVRYAPSGFDPTVCTNGATVVSIVFTTQYYLTLQSTSGGIPLVVTATGAFTTSQWIVFGTALSLSVVTLPSFVFLGWNGTGLGNYTGTQATGGVVMDGAISEVAAFGKPWVPPAARYTASFTTAAPFAPGTAWSLVLGGVGYSTTGPVLNVTGLLAGTYAVSVGAATSPDGSTRYTPSSPPTQLSVTHNVSTGLAYTVAYEVTVRATAGGAVVTPLTTTGWYTAGTKLALAAVPDSGHTFVGWVGTGASSITTTNSTPGVTVNGPLTEVATFAPAPPVVQATTATSVWTNVPFLAELAVAGLLVGIVVGLLVTRGRRPPPGAWGPGGGAP